MATYLIKPSQDSSYVLSADSAGNMYLATYASSGAAIQKWRINGLETGVTVYEDATNPSKALDVHANFDCAINTNGNGSSVNFEAVGSAYRITTTVGGTTLHLAASSNTQNASVKWVTSSTSLYYQTWYITRTDYSENMLVMPYGRVCNWNQFYTPIVDALQSTKGCSIVSALDVCNFYGPNSYTIDDVKANWSSSLGLLSWEYNWPGYASIAASSVSASGSTALGLIKEQIDLGHPPIVVFGTLEPRNVHFVMCYGYKNNGLSTDNIWVMDPANKNSSSSTGLDWTLAQSIDYNQKGKPIQTVRYTSRKT